MKSSKARRKQQFVDITGKREVAALSVCKKMGITMAHMHQLICDLRRDGHEIWVISKGGRDEKAFYRHIKGPAIRLNTRDRMIDMLKDSHHSIEFIAQTLFLETTSIRSALRKIRKEYKLDVIRGSGNQNKYKIVGELNETI